MYTEKRIFILKRNKRSMISSTAFYAGANLAIVYKGEVVYTTEYGVRHLGMMTQSRMF